MRHLFAVLFAIGIFFSLYIFPQPTFAAPIDCAAENGSCRTSCPAGSTTDTNGICPGRQVCCFVPLSNCNQPSGRGPGCACGSTGSLSNVGYCAVGISCCGTYTYYRECNANGQPQVGGGFLCRAASGGSSCNLPNPNPKPADYASIRTWTGTCVGGSTTGGGTPPPPVYDITGKVFVDDGRNGTAGLARDGVQTCSGTCNNGAGDELNYSGATIRLSGRARATRTTNSSGNYAFNNFPAGSYSVLITIPSGYVNTNSVVRNTTLGGNKTIPSFGIVQQYSIGGDVFNDVNKNGVKDNGEANILSGIAITSSSGTPYVNQGSGQYILNNLFAGTYTISYTSPPPPGYFMIHPLNGPPPQHRVTVGPNCQQEIGLSFGATCSNGNAFGVSFAVSISIPWHQTYGSDVRIDEGYENKIPATPLYPPYASVADTLNRSAKDASSLADAEAEFTGTQGGNRWSYGFSNGAAYNGSNFLSMPQFTNNTWYVQNGAYWTQISPATMHPNKGNWQQWPVRRWTSNINGPITITGQLADASPGTTGVSDGITGYIFVNGAQAYSRVINDKDTTGVNYSVNANVNVGTNVDFAVSPNNNDYADTTKFTAIINNGVSSCGDPSTPTGSIISTGVPITASTTIDNWLPRYLVDGVIDGNYWNSGRYPPGWVEINLGSPQTVTGLQLWVTPGATSTHQILTGTSPNPTNLRRTLTCNFLNENTYNVVFTQPLTNTQYIRINTTASNQWLAWREIRVYGSAPGTQTTSPGIIFTGDGSSSFGQGAASTENWVVGGLAGGLNYSEVFSTTTNPSTTAYDYMYDKITHANIPVTELNTPSICPSLASCTLPATLSNGVYHATGDVTLNASTFQTNKNYIFLIDGNLTIQGNIVVPNGSTAFFSSSNDIIVDRSVGTATNLYPLPSGQVQGIFSANRDFVIDGINNCVTGKDKMLNVEGVIITNALGNGGQFRTQRDLCGDNPNIPSFTIRLRLDFVLNAPIVLMRQKTTYREAAP